MFAINLMTPMESCRTAVAAMRTHGNPAHLVNASSLAGNECDSYAYGVSKVALTHMGHTLRGELQGELSQYKRMCAELAHENFALKDVIERKL